MNTTGCHAGIAPRLFAIGLGIALLASCASTETTADDGNEAVDVALDSGSATYTITAGDTLTDIAQRAGVSLAALIAANGWLDGNSHLIVPGDVITLPQGAATPEPRPAAPTVTPRPTDTGSSAAGNTPIDENGLLACDGAAIQAAIGDPDFITFDEIGCENGWAGGGYLNSENTYTPVILRAEGQRWVMQDWTTVCDRYPDMANQAKLYCPGG